MKIKNMKDLDHSVLLIQFDLVTGVKFIILFCDIFWRLFICRIISLINGYSFIVTINSFI